MRWTIIITSVIFFALVAYAHLLDIANEPLPTAIYDQGFGSAPAFHAGLVPSRAD